MNIGEQLTRLREQKGLKQKEAAEALNISNVVLNRYEKNERFPDKKMLNQLANFYNCSIDYLVGRTNNQNENLAEPSDLELEEFLKNNNVKFDGTPLDEEDKQDVLEFLRMVLKRKKK